MRFRTKPVVIDAVRCSDALHSAAKEWRGLPGWLSLAYESGNVVFGRDHIFIHAPSKTVRADSNDWIVYGSEGEIFSCSPLVFAASYEQVD